MVESGEFVVPGAELGFSEEFIPGEGAFEENGKVYAAITGILTVDQKERRIAVTPRTSIPPVLKDGDIVVGGVVDVKQQVAIVNIFKKTGSDRSLPGDLTGSVHISQTKGSYVSELGREFQVGDIVKAGVINARRVPVQLSTVENGFGVLKAFCGACNVPLIKSGDILKCRDCGRTESRRYATDYGIGQV